jgi:hypothetical protein
MNNLLQGVKQQFQIAAPIYSGLVNKTSRTGDEFPAV